MNTLSPTPVSNTGLDSQTDNRVLIRPDWLQVITSHFEGRESFLKMIRFLEQHFQDEIDFAWDRPIYRGQAWDSSGRSVRGIQVAAREKDGKLEGWVLIPGACWASQNLRTAWEVCQRLRFSWDARATRLDIALDDYTKSLDLDKVLAAAESGSYCWASSHEFHLSRRRGSSAPGRSIVFGSPSSDKRFTIYDKSVESQGEIDAIRCEARLRDFRANFVFEHFCNFVPDTEECPTFEVFLQKSYSFLCECLFGCVNFIERIDKNLSRCPVLDWWREFIEFCGSCVPKRLPPENYEPSFQKSVNWLFRQVSSSLAVYKRVFGRSAIEALISVGEQNLSAWHESLIRVYCHDY